MIFFQMQWNVDYHVIQSHLFFHGSLELLFRPMGTLFDLLPTLLGILNVFVSSNLYEMNIS